MAIAKIKELNTYPIKSCAGLRSQTLAFDKYGPLNDRQWMIVNAGGRFVTQRTHPQMSQIFPKLADQELQIAFDQSSFSLPLDHFQESREVKVWRYEGPALKHRDKELNEALSEFLKMDCELVMTSQNHDRLSNEKYTSEESSIRFSDGFQFLILSESALEQLNSSLPSPISSDCFRANIIIEDCLPHSEDEWITGIEISGQKFFFAKKCTRCPVINVDQKTGEKLPVNLLKELKKSRTFPEGLCFGSYFFAERPGEIQIGDEINLVE